MMFLKDVCKRLEQYFNFCVSKTMVAITNYEMIYTFNSKCQKSSKSQASFFILKVSIMILAFLFYMLQKTRGPKGLGLLTLECLFIRLGKSIN